MQALTGPRLRPSQKWWRFSGQMRKSLAPFPCFVNLNDPPPPSGAKSWIRAYIRAFFARFVVHAAHNGSRVTVSGTGFESTISWAVHIGRKRASIPETCIEVAILTQIFLCTDFFPRIDILNTWKCLISSRASQVERTCNENSNKVFGLWKERKVGPSFHPNSSKLISHVN